MKQNRAIGEAYWPEIDGLRAIAIVLVVGFHVGLPVVRGGFIGVDVFFVISGYLITGLLAREVSETGRIDLLDFYARRARRLLPALFIVLVATIALGKLLLVPVGEQQRLAQSAIAASSFLANIFFWRTQSHYFADSAEEIPLLHLWTLAVEEQFYIVCPLVMLAIAIVSQRKNADAIAWIVAAFVAALFLSFVACWWLTPSRTTMVFYMPLFRAWEFCVGGLIALSISRMSDNAIDRRMSEWLVLVGLCAVVGAAIIFNNTTMFPGALAAIPVLGTAAAIVGLRSSRSGLVARGLSSKPLVLVGKLSYSWYLWHWPLLALARSASPGSEWLLRDIALVLLALVLSALTFRYVEEPVRRQRPWPFASAGQSVAAGVALMLMSAGLALVLWSSADQRMAKDPVLRMAGQAMNELSSFPADCQYFGRPFTGLAPMDVCTLGRGSSGPQVLLWGDSHADHFKAAFEKLAEATSARVVVRTMGGCKPYVDQIPAGLLGGAQVHHKNCVAFNRAVDVALTEVKASGVQTIVLAARWSDFHIHNMRSDEWGPHLQKLMASLVSRGFKVAILAEVPRHETSVPRCVARRGLDACGRPRAEVDLYRGSSLGVLQALTTSMSGVRMWDPANELCRADQCLAARDGTVLYSDNNHLSVGGARLLAPAIGAFLTRPQDWDAHRGSDTAREAAPSKCVSQHVLGASQGC